MKSLFVFVLVISAFSRLSAATFPGLRAVLTPAEWSRAGLDRLTPDEIGVIDAALIRQQTGAVQAEVRASAPAAEMAPPSKPAPKGWLEKFGLPTWGGPDWRSLPPLKAKVVSWEGGNRFRLDNGQVWEGFEAIPYDLPGHDVEIQPRPNDQYNLSVEGKNTKVRVMRLR